MNDQGTIDINAYLDKLVDAEAHLDLLRISKQDLVDGVITDEVKALLKEIDDEFDPKIEGVQDQINGITEAIKAAVIAVGETVKNEFKMVVFNKGRASWDTKGLDGYAVAHPEILSFKKIGSPSASIRNR